jgi:cell division protein FtsW (lipid II flippase)
VKDDPITNDPTLTSSTLVPDPSRPERGPFTARGLHEQARELHVGGIRWWNVGWICVAAALLLNVVGIVAIGTTEPGFARKQALFVPIGLVAAAICAAPDYRRFRQWVPFLCVATVVLLVFVLVPLVPEVIVRPRKGARRWINLGVTDFQPSEFAKVVWMLAMASWFRLRWNVRSIPGFLLPFAITAVPVILILLEPDLGTALLFVPTLFALLLVAGARLWHLGLVIGVGVLAVGSVLFVPQVQGVLKSHQQDRVKAVVAQWNEDPRYRDDIGYQGFKAMTLVGAGGVQGVGRDHASTLVRYNHLPEEHNDMVFAVITCRWGFLGGVVVWTLFGLLGLGGYLVSAFARDTVGRVLAAGLVTMLLVQMVINTGMTIGLLPITGMTLPFVSAGGSSLVTAWMTIGLILNVALRRPRRMERG